MARFEVSIMPGLGRPRVVLGDVVAGDFESALRAAEASLGPQRPERLYDAKPIPMRPRLRAIVLKGWPKGVA